VAYLLERRTGYPRGEVAKYLNRDSATVGTLLGWLAKRVVEDAVLEREIDRLNKKVMT